MEAREGDEDVSESTFEHTGKKKAVLIGVSYNDGEDMLQGTVTDVRNATSMLKNYYGFKDSEILILMEKSHSRFSFMQRNRKEPTRENILEGMRWLVNDSEEGDFLFFLFSGHGTTVEDLDGDEDDCWDEAIVPVDSEENGVIVDDEMYDVMVKNVAKGARLFAVFDCCFSGTILDLPFHYDVYGTGEGASNTSAGARSRRLTIREAACELKGAVADVREKKLGMRNALKRVGKRVREGKSFEGRVRNIDADAGEVYLVSGCMDGTTSQEAESSALKLPFTASKLNGLMTTALKTVVEEAFLSDGSLANLSYHKLFYDVRRETIRSSAKSGGDGSPHQFVQFSSSHKVNLRKTFAP